MKRVPLSFVRNVSTATTQSTKAAGDISSVFPSLSGKAAEPLPPRFQALKSQLSAGREKDLTDSWWRLLDSLRDEVKKIKALGSDVSEHLSENNKLQSQSLINCRLFLQSITKTSKTEP